MPKLRVRISENSEFEYRTSTLVYTKTRQKYLSVLMRHFRFFKKLNFIYLLNCLYFQILLNFLTFLTHISTIKPYSYMISNGGNVLFLQLKSLPSHFWGNGKLPLKRLLKVFLKIWQFSKKFGGFPPIWRVSAELAGFR